MGIKRFWAQESEMALIPISSRESARKNFSLTRRTSGLECSNQTFLGSGSRNYPNTNQFARISEKKIFMNSTHIMSRKWESNLFCSGSRNDSNTHQFAGMSEKKSFNERTSCLESGKQTFLGSGVRNGSNTHHFARIGEKKFFMNSTYIMSTKWEWNVFGLRRPKWL